jgi:hypothetical protein
MARPRGMSPTLYNFYANIDARHLAHAISEFQQNGLFKATKSTSTLIRSIVESWIVSQGGCKVETLDQAKEIFENAGLTFERTERVKDRGHHGNTYADEEEQDKREERGVKKVNLDDIALMIVNQAKLKGILPNNKGE